MDPNVRLCHPNVLRRETFRLNAAHAYCRRRRCRTVRPHIGPPFGVGLSANTSPIFPAKCGQLRRAPTGVGYSRPTGLSGPPSNSSQHRLSQRSEPSAAVSRHIEHIWSRVQAQLALVVDESTYRIWLEPLSVLELDQERLLVEAPPHASAGSRTLRRRLRRAWSSCWGPGDAGASPTSRRAVRRARRTGPRHTGGRQLHSAARRHVRGRATPGPQRKARSATPSTPSSSSSSATATASPTPPRSPSPRCPRRPTTRSSSTARPASARPTCCTRSRNYVGCLRRRPDASATPPPRRSRTTSSPRSRQRSIEALQAALPRRRRPADRRRPVPRAQGAAARRSSSTPSTRSTSRAPARAHLRPPPARPAGARGPPARALRGGPGHRHRAARPRHAPRDPAQARAARRHRARRRPTRSSCIAERVTTNVRALEGALIARRLQLAHRPAARRPSSPQTSSTALYPRRAGRRSRSIAEIQAAACAHFGLSRRRAALVRARAARIVWPRQVAMYLARELTDALAAGDRQAFGGRDHTTVCTPASAFGAHRATTLAARLWRTCAGRSQPRP